MKNNQNIENIIEKLDEDEKCEFCQYGGMCTKKVTSSGNGPEFPPCWDTDYINMFDYELYCDIRRNNYE